VPVNESVRAWVEALSEDKGRRWDEELGRGYEYTKKGEAILIVPKSPSHPEGATFDDHGGLFVDEAPAMRSYNVYFGLRPESESDHVTRILAKYVHLSRDGNGNGAAVQATSHPDFRSYVQDRVAVDPTWLFRRGMFAVTLLVLVSAGLMALSPALGIVGLSFVFVAWGIVGLSDAAVRGGSIHDPRFSTLMVIVGLGSLAVALVAKLTH
jgi:hypothetical protein